MTAASDLTDVTRQVVSNRSRTLLPRIKAAYDARDAAGGETTSRDWHQQLALLEKVTATSRQTMLGPWLADARSWGADDTQADALEHSARRLLTVWGNRSGYDAGLADYANRQWSGLIGSYYAPRWKAYVDSLSAALKDGRPPTAFDWYQHGADWAASTKSLPRAPTGDIRKVAAEVLAFLRAHPEPVTSTATASPADQHPGRRFLDHHRGAAQPRPVPGRREGPGVADRTGRRGSDRAATVGRGGPGAGPVRDGDLHR